MSNKDYQIYTHDKISSKCEFVTDLSTVNYTNYDVICINEGQFFTGLVDFCKDVIKNNKTIIQKLYNTDSKSYYISQISTLTNKLNNLIQKILKNLEGEKRKLEKDREKTARNTDDQNIRIENENRSIGKNMSDQESKKKEIEKQNENDCGNHGLG